MKVFVTGGSGFVGRHMIKMLRDRGDEVIALARSDRSAEQVTQLGAKAVRGELLDEPLMIQAMQGCEVVFHIAGYLDIWGKYQAFYQTNVLGTECTLAAAQAANVPCFVQIGAAASVFDRQPLSQIDESYPLQQPKFSPFTRIMVRLIGQELTFRDRKAQQELGYAPIVTRDLGLAELTENFKKI